MSDLKRLLSHHDDEFELALLRSADVDEPAKPGMLRTAAALGLTATLTAGTVAVTSGATLSASTLSGAGSSAKIGVGLVWKYLGIGAVSGIATMAGLQVAGVLPAPTPAAPTEVAAAAPALPAPTRPVVVSWSRATGAVASDDLAEPPPVSSTDEPPHPVRSSAERAAAPVVEERAARGATSPEPAAKPVPRVEPAPSAVGVLPPVAPEPEPQASAAKPEPERAPSLAVEIATIDRARRALRGQDPRAALSVLDEYQRKVTTRVLETEALLLRIDALVQLGDRRAASALARQVISRQPQGRYADRLRELASEYPGQ